MTVLEDLFRGKIQPHRNLNVSDPDFKPSGRIIGEVTEWLQTRLTAKEFQRFEELETAFNEHVSLSQKKGFLYGFKLGSLLMLEILSSDKELSDDDN